jgi:type II secretory pathway pseudopilin PulG
MIELLVVMIIIGILAAIAIPTFLGQRKNGYRTTLKDDLKNASTGLESAAVTKLGDFTLGGTIAAGQSLWTSGGNQTGSPVKVEFNGTTGNTLTIVRLTSSNYCIEGTNASLASETWSFTKSHSTASSSGVPVSGACPASIP